MTYPAPFDYFGAGGYTEYDTTNGFYYWSAYDHIGIFKSVCPTTQHFNPGMWARLTQTKIFSQPIRLNITVRALCCPYSLLRNRLYVDDMVNPIWELASGSWWNPSNHIISNVLFGTGSHTIRYEVYVLDDWGWCSTYGSDQHVGIIDYEIATNPIAVGDTVLLIPNHGDKYSRAAIKGWDINTGDNVNLHPLKGGAKVAINDYWSSGDSIIF